MKRTRGALVAILLTAGALSACSGSSTDQNVSPTDQSTSTRKINADGSFFTGPGYIEGLPITAGETDLAGVPTEPSQLSVGDCFSDDAQIELEDDATTFVGLTECSDPSTGYWVIGVITEGTENLTTEETDTGKALAQCDGFPLTPGAPGAATTVIRPTNTGTQAHAGPIICLASDGTIPSISEY